MANIDSKLFFDGNVKTLRFMSDKGNIVSIGVIMPGVWDFGVITAKEKITVTSGVITINDKKLGVGESITIDSGEKVIHKAEIASSYICEFIT